MRELIENLERRMGKDIEELFVVYHNPVWAEVLDSRRSWPAITPLCREYDHGERAFSLSDLFPTVIWQDTRATHRTPWSNAARHMVRVDPQRATAKGAPIDRQFALPRGLASPVRHSRAHL